MIIKILNKNKINPSGDYSLENIQSFATDEGQVLTVNYNETLDSMTIRMDKKYSVVNQKEIIENIDSPIEIEPFDVVFIYLSPLLTGDNIKVMLVDTINETQTCVNPAIYSYEITLFSLVKELEGVLLPNLSITQLFTGEKRKIGYYLQKYNNDYGLKIRNNGSFINKYEFSTETLNYFNQFECPEMMWNAPTLREVFNDLMMVKDCIPYIDSDFKIKHLNLTEKKRNLENDQYINKIQSSRSSADYVSELKMNLVNVVQNNNDKVKNTVTKMEFVPFTTRDSYIMNTDNIVIKTRFPILKIKHLYMIIEGEPESSSEFYSSYGGAFIKIDLCNVQGAHDNEPVNLVYEESEWKTKDLVYRLDRLTEVNRNGKAFFPFSTLSQYQNTTLHYKRGDVYIDGLANVTTNTKTFFGIQWSRQNIELYGYAMQGDCCDASDFDFSDVTTANIRTIFMSNDEGTWYYKTLFQIFPKPDCF